MTSTGIENVSRDFAEVFIESEQGHSAHGDCLTEGFVSGLPPMTHLTFKQNDPSDLLRIWGQWSFSQKEKFAEKYGDIVHLLAVKIDEQLIRAMIEFWDPTHCCFMINQIDLTSTVEEYAHLLRLNHLEDNMVHIREQNSGTIRKILIKFFGKKFVETGTCSIQLEKRSTYPLNF